MKTTKKIIAAGALSIVLTVGAVAPAQAVAPGGIATAPSAGQVVQPGGGTGGAAPKAAMACMLLRWLPWCW